MVNIKFNSEKALEAILYVASKAPIPDIYHVIKALYFADLKHLDRYGRLITGDKYIAMRYGPVASGALDIVNLAKGKQAFLPAGISIDTILNSVDVVGKNINAIRQYRESAFSESDIECLDEAISEIGGLDFDTICQKSHGSAWESADENGEISFSELAKESDPSGLLLKYLGCGA